MGVLSTIVAKFDSVVDTIGQSVFAAVAADVTQMASALGVLGLVIAGLQHVLGMAKYVQYITWVIRYSIAVGTLLVWSQFSTIYKGLDAGFNGYGLLVLKGVLATPAPAAGGTSGLEDAAAGGGRTVLSAGDTTTRSATKGVAAKQSISRMPRTVVSAGTGGTGGTGDEAKTEEELRLEFLGGGIGGLGVLRPLSTDKETRSAKREEEKDDRKWWDKIGDGVTDGAQWIWDRGEDVVEAVDACLTDSLGECVEESTEIVTGGEVNLTPEGPGPRPASVRDSITGATGSDKPFSASAIVMDAIVDNVFWLSKDSFSRVRFGNLNQNIKYIFFGIVIFVVGGIYAAVSCLILIYSKIGLMIAIGLAPLGIIMLILPATTPYFHTWLKFMLGFLVTPMLVASIAGIIGMVTIDYIDTSAATGELVDHFHVIVTTIAGIYITLQVPSLASSLTGGAGIGNLASAVVAKATGGGGSSSGGGGVGAAGGMGASGGMGARGSAGASRMAMAGPKGMVLAAAISATKMVGSAVSSMASSSKSRNK